MCSTMQPMCSAEHVSEICDDLLWLYEQSTRRRLTDAAKWSAEMLLGVSTYASEENMSIDSCSMMDSSSNVMSCTPSIVRPSSQMSTTIHRRPLPSPSSHAVRMSLALIDAREFERSALTVSERVLADPSNDQYATFLYFYAKYLSAEKRTSSTLTDLGDTPDDTHKEELRQMIVSLGIVRDIDSADPFVLFLYAQLLANVDKAEARLCLQRIINAMPAFWPAWALLVGLVTDAFTLKSLNLPRSHWLYALFVCECRLRWQQLEDTVEVLHGMHEGVFRHCPYVTARLANAYKADKQSEDSLACYEMIFAEHPYRLDDHDAYSCELFIQSKSHADDTSSDYRIQLCKLAHTCQAVDPLARQTCVVLGNYHGKRNEHELAVVQFERALRIDPTAGDGVWTLIGHEFMEMKNSSAACLAYRRALDADPTDYRAWYGLGQMYDILRMPSHALYYYNMAHKCRPTDSRMLVALGDMYHKLGKLSSAQKCYWRAHCVGDVECQAIVRLARLYDKEGEPEQAAKCYVKYLTIADEQEEEDLSVKLSAYRFMAEYCLSRGEIDNAMTYVHELSDEPTLREESRSLHRRIEKAQMAAAAKERLRFMAEGRAAP